MTTTNYPAVIKVGAGINSYVLPLVPLIEPYLLAHVHESMREDVRTALIAKLTSEEMLHPSQSHLKYLEGRVATDEREIIFLREVIAYFVSALDAIDFESSALEWKAVKRDEYPYGTEAVITWYAEQKKLLEPECPF